MRPKVRTEVSQFWDGALPVSLKYARFVVLAAGTTFAFAKRRELPGYVRGVRSV